MLKEIVFIMDYDQTWWDKSKDGVFNLGLDIM